MDQKGFEKNSRGLNKALFQCFAVHHWRYEQPTSVTVTDVVVATIIAQLRNMTIAAFPVKNIMSK
jgi:hypothetical protein